MRTSRIIVAAALGCACSSNSGGSPSLDGTWLYSNSAGTAGQSLTLKSDGTYAFGRLELTSSTSANTQVETGTFTVAGSTITGTPTQWSCPGPDPVFHVSYSFSGSNLEIATPSGAVVYQPDTATASNFAIAIGCFDSNGNFKPEPLAPVSN